MIATILPGSSNFHAVDYNERKVAKGVARLLEIKNFGALGEVRKPTPEELAQFLMEYSSMNPRIQKAQFHAAISCKGYEMSEAQLLDFATSIFKKWAMPNPDNPGSFIPTTIQTMHTYTLLLREWRPTVARYSITMNADAH